MSHMVMSAEAEPERPPRPKAPGLAAGVDEAMIRRLVHGFYAKVRRDGVLGPVFDRAVADWDEHLAKLCDFWSSVTLMTGRYKGQPMPVHAGIPEIGPELFARWLALFGETARELCPPEAAALFADRAARIAEGLKLGIAVLRGQSTIGVPLRAGPTPRRAPEP
jgi:hemoglobin